MEDFNPFKHLLDNESLPPEHKEAVMQTIDMLKLMASMVDLFSVKQAKTNTSLISQVLSGGKDEAPDHKPAAESADGEDSTPRQNRDSENKKNARNDSLADPEPEQEQDGE